MLMPDSSQWTPAFLQFERGYFNGWGALDSMVSRSVVLAVKP
jgi:hypothetical protein